MAFPKKNIFGSPVDWKDLGLMQRFSTEGGTISSAEICTFCKTRVRIGREQGKMFKFCSICEWQEFKDNP